MKLVITDLGRGVFTVEDFDPASLMDLLDSWTNENPLLTFAVNDGTTYIPKAAVARIDTYDDDGTPAVGPWLSPDCRDENHRKCNGVAWDDAADAPTECQCRDLTHGAAGDPHQP